MPITVYILTTQGPVRIQRIAEEQTGIQSVMCLDGRSQALPISSRYDAFVRNPTGVIERATGHGAYRVDVDAVIDAGDSWQLGIYIAHITDEIDVPEDIHIFATGEIDRDLNIRSVGHVDEKMDRAAEVLNGLREAGKKFHVFVPGHSLEEVTGNNPYSVTQVEHVDVVFEQLGLKHPLPSSRIINVGKGEAAGSTVMRRLLLIGLSLMALTGLFLWTPLAWVGLANDGKVLELESAIADEGSTFFGRYQQSTFFFIQNFNQPERVELELKGEVSLALVPGACEQDSTRRQAAWDGKVSALETICGLIVKAENREIGSVIVGRMGYWPNGLGQGSKPERTMRGSAGVNGHAWKLKFENFPNKGTVVRMVILQGLAAPVGSQPWYATLLSEPTTSSAFDEAKSRIERLGYHVTVKDWQRP